ncbi:AMP-binding protein [Vibrio nigripulchritudo]|uniref:AMP-binding protein n=1 Tax=Vibrio nigripulchritudo TaxID=28173 RepID=UPI0005FA5DB3|nr:AMP-binding protein [Vibrio nigripulchritudo]
MREQIYQTVKASANQPALWVANQHYSYQELTGRASRIGEACVSLGTEKVAILAHRSFYAYASVLGCYLAGLAWVPMNNKKSPAQLAEIMQDTATQVLVCDANHQRLLKLMLEEAEQSWTILFDSDIDLNEWEQAFPSHSFQVLDGPLVSTEALRPVQDDSLAYIMHTSGSTGKPKRIPISYHNLSCYLENIREAFPLETSDRVAQFSDLSFDLSIHDMFSAWMHGACLYCVPEILKTNPVQFIRHHEITTWLSVPSVIDLSMQRDALEPGSIPSLKLSIFCGQALATDLAHQWQQASGQKVVNIYGPTECTVTVTAHTYSPEHDSDQISVPVGNAFRKDTLAIANEAGTPVLIESLKGETQGELFIRGVQLAGEYWNDDENTQRAYFTDDSGTLWYKTGDLVKWDTNVLHHLGRNDHQVKIAGHRVELGEIETAARKITGLASVAAVPWPLSKAGYANGVVVFFQSENTLNHPEIIRAFAQQLPRAVSPKQIFTLEKLPRNINGKTDVNALYQKLQEIAS